MASILSGLIGRLDQTFSSPYVDGRDCDRVKSITCVCYYLDRMLLSPRSGPGIYVL